MNIKLDGIQQEQITHVERRDLEQPYENYQVIEFKVFYNVKNQPKQVSTVFIKEHVDNVLFDVYGNVKGYILNDV